MNNFLMKDCKLCKLMMLFGMPTLSTTWQATLSLQSSIINKGRNSFLMKHYLWDDPYLYKHRPDQIIRQCVSEKEIINVLRHCHSLECGGHFGGARTAAKVLQSGFYLPTLFKDAHSFVVACDRCQRTRNISRRNEMLLNNILEVELFDV